MNKFFGLSLLTLVFVSCQNTGERKTTNTAPSTPATLTLPPANAGTQNGNSTTTNNTSTVTLNPEHGAPGHRCELPVGAPLNGTPSPTPTINNNIAPVTLQPQLPAQPAKSNARTNPAHGVPGHNCSIPVGSPI